MGAQGKTKKQGVDNASEFDDLGPSGYSTFDGGSWPPWATCIDLPVVTSTVWFCFSIVW